MVTHELSSVTDESESPRSEKVRKGRFSGTNLTDIALSKSSGTRHKEQAALTEGPLGLSALRARSIKVVFLP